MSSMRRTRSPDSVSPALQATSPASSGAGSAPRQTSVRISRRSTGGGTGSRSSGRASTSSRSQRAVGRTRRPTPIVRRRRVRGTADQDTEVSATEDEEQVGAGGSGGRRRRTVTVARSGRDGRRQEMRVTSDSDLRWYERLMPDFFLNMTAPITGYENRLDSDVEDDEYEVLERQRLRRNRRVRRRLLGLLILATAAGFFLYSRGRIFRKAGMKACVNTMKHRIEGGLAKTIQDTMGK